MMAVKIKTICPLGCECEKVSGDSIERCAWYVKLQGNNPQDGSPIDEWRCSIAWQPLLLIQGNGMLAGTNESIQSLRNETVKRQDIALGVMNNVTAIESK
jgi:hypothetical protein